MVNIYIYIYIYQFNLINIIYYWFFNIYIYTYTILYTILFVWYILGNLSGAIPRQSSGNNISIAVENNNNNNNNNNNSNYNNNNSNNVILEDAFESVALDCSFPDPHLSSTNSDDVNSMDYGIKLN